MQSLKDFFAENNDHDIHTLARYIELHINENWDTVYQSLRDEMIELYKKIGDSAYGLYGQRLFKPIYDQFKDVNLQSKPRYPFGSFNISREWGPEDNRQRWFWSKISTLEGTPVGTIAVAFFHDHYQVRIPEPTKVLGIEQTTKGDVIKALSRAVPGFATALEARVEYAEYFK
jgi:hypothetical protein